MNPIHLTADVGGPCLQHPPEGRGVGLPLPLDALLNPGNPLRAQNDCFSQKKSVLVLQKKQK